jgi:transcriptional regulator with XRE-family HTH domain
MDQDQGVGREVKRLRDERGWSQTRLAVEAGMSVSGISMIENGHRNLSTATLAKLAEALGVEVRDLFPLGQAPLPLEDQRLMDRPEVWEWLQEQGHMDREEFLSWAEEHESLEGVEDAIQELHNLRDSLLEALRAPTVRKMLFPIEQGLSKEEVKKALLKQPSSAWKLGNEIRHEYLAREVALVNYSRQLFVESETSDYLVYGPPNKYGQERHERLLAARRVLEASLKVAV